MKLQCPLVVVLLIVIIGECFKAEPIVNEMNPGGGTKGEAYVTLLYGEYLLPVRVLGLSLRLSGTQREMIVLCTEEVSTESRKILNDDGWTVKPIKAIPSPYPNHAKQYSKVFTKLMVWTLTEYRRVVFMDSDTLVYANIDELFHCGKFCAAYRHSDLFNSGVLVVKPDLLEYHNLISKIGIYPSYDNGEQGFLNYYHKSLVFAPMFNVSNTHNQEEPMRLPAAYNADVAQYYGYTSRFFPFTRFKVLHHTLGPVKPWRWWAYPIFDLNWYWVDLRNNLQPSPDSPMGLILAAVVNFLLLVSMRGLKYLNFQPIVLKIRRFHLSIIAASILVLSYVLGFIAVPDSMHPCYAIPTFCLWTLFFLQLFCFFLRTVTVSSQTCRFASCKCTFLIGMLPLAPLVVPLFISAFFTRVCVFLTLIALCVICSHIIFIRSLNNVAN